MAQCSKPLGPGVCPRCRGPLRPENSGRRVGLRLYHKTCVVRHTRGR